MSKDILKRLRTDSRALTVTQFLMDRGASSGFIRRLEHDLANLPAEYQRRRELETRGEHQTRFHELARQTRQLARRWKLDPWASVWTLLPNLEIVTNTRMKDQGGKLLPTVNEYLDQLAAELEHEAGRERLEPLLTRRMGLQTYVASGCLLALAETGVYLRRPMTHATILASIVLNQNITVDTVKKATSRN